MGKYKLAIENYKKAIELGRGFIAAYAQRRNAYQKTGKHFNAFVDGVILNVLRFGKQISGT